MGTVGHKKMRELKILHSKKFAIVDDEDYSRLSLHTWYLDANRDRIIGTVNGKQINIARFILRTSAPMPDHKDLDIFNNQKSNLRAATVQQNHANRYAPVSNTSGYKGVSWHKTSEKWRAYISWKNHYIHLGNFYTKEEAAKAYNEAALERFGEFARLNIIEEIKEEEKNDTRSI